MKWYVYSMKICGCFPMYGDSHGGDDGVSHDGVVQGGDVVASQC